MHLKWFVRRKVGLEMRAGFIWLRTGASDELL
jgi:hypothetical protein